MCYSLKLVIIVYNEMIASNAIFIRKYLYFQGRQHLLHKYHLEQFIKSECCIDVLNDTISLSCRRIFPPILQRDELCWCDGGSAVVDVPVLTVRRQENLLLYDKKIIH